LSPPGSATEQVKNVGGTVTHDPNFGYDNRSQLTKATISNISPGIDEPIAMIDVVDSDKHYWYHYDALGSVIALSNNGSIVEAYSYDVFGSTKVHTVAGADSQWLTSDDTIANPTVSAYANPYMFTARRMDTLDSGDLKIYYYRARYYKPDIGRFLQTDPIGYAGGLNLYIYVGNNPINWIDSWGLSKECPVVEEVIDTIALPANFEDPINRLKAEEELKKDKPFTCPDPFSNPAKEIYEKAINEVGKGVVRGKIRLVEISSAGRYRGWLIIQKYRERRFLWWKWWSRVGKPYAHEVTGGKGWGKMQGSYRNKRNAEDAIESQRDWLFPNYRH